MVLWFSRKRDSRSFLSIHLKKLRSNYLEFYQPIFFCFLFFGKNRLGSSHVSSPFSFFLVDRLILFFSIFITIFFREGEIVWWMVLLWQFFCKQWKSMDFSGTLSFLRVSSNFSECLSFLQLNAHRLFVTVYSQSSSYTILFNIFYSSKISSKFNL